MVCVCVCVCVCVAHEDNVSTWTSIPLSIHLYDNNEHTIRATVVIWSNLVSVRNVLLE